MSVEVRIGDTEGVPDRPLDSHMPRKRRLRAHPDNFSSSVYCDECEDSECFLNDGWAWTCPACGLCHDVQGSDLPGGFDDYERSCITKRSCHDPEIYFRKLLEDKKVDPRLHNQLSKCFRAISHFAEETRPGNKCNSPN